MPEKKEEARNIGLNVKAPADKCSDKNCPFHGTLPVRGQVITGIVSSVKMQDTILVKKEYMSYVPKYERYEKRTSTYSAHCPPCIKTKAGIAPFPGPPGFAGMEGCPCQVHFCSHGKRIQGLILQSASPLEGTARSMKHPRRSSVNRNGRWPGCAGA